MVVGMLKWGYNQFLYTGLLFDNAKASYLVTTSYGKDAKSEARPGLARTPLKSLTLTISFLNEINIYDLQT